MKFATDTMLQQGTSTPSLTSLTDYGIDAVRQKIRLSVPIYKQDPISSEWILVCTVFIPHDSKRPIPVIRWQEDGE